MIYEFFCDECNRTQVVTTKAFQPPNHPYCCGRQTRRIYSAQIDTSGCKDHDFVPEDKRVFDSVQPMSGEKKGRIFSKHIDDRRKLLRDGGNKGDFRHTHSVPADLYHAKIKETGDKRYWDDPKNVERHKSCRVDS